MALLIGVAVLVAFGIWFSGYIVGKDHGKWLATPSPPIPTSKLSPAEIEAAVIRDEWLEAKSPFCEVGETNLVHEVIGACPCL